MDQVGVAELKARLSQYLARVREGEEILVSDRGRPIARIVPADPRSEDEEWARLQDMERRGLVRLGKGHVGPDYWELELPEDPESGVLAALLEEREGGR